MSFPVRYRREGEVYFGTYLDFKPTLAEAERDESESARHRRIHNFELPCGPEDFDPRPAWRSDYANQEPSS